MPSYARENRDLVVLCKSEVHRYCPLHCKCLRDGRGYIILPAPIILNMRAHHNEMAFWPGSASIPTMGSHDFHAWRPGTSSIVILIWEELPIALASNLGVDGCRGTCRGGDEFEILPACRPANSGTILDDLGIVLILLIAKMDTFLHTAPANVKRNIRGYGRSMF